MAKTVALAISGGIDSAVTAHLLLKKGYDVFGITMIVHADSNEVTDAKKVCDFLGIKHYILDLTNDFHDEVITPFVSAYFNGVTPNPCMICNKQIKFGKLMDYALSMGADYFATGHYVRIHQQNGLFHLMRGLEPRKDQSYLFHFMNQKQLGKILTPLGEYRSKEEIRQIASRLKLPVSGKKDSDGLCFTSGRSYSEYLHQEYPENIQKGEYQDFNRKVLGYFPSIIHHTVGQKRGLFLNGQHSYRVAEINSEENIIRLGHEKDLYHQEMLIFDVSFTSGSHPTLPIDLNIQMFQWGLLLPATLSKYNGRFKITFKENARAIAKGQYAVFYHDDEVFGGGMIDCIIK
jgi:tRNA-specific 2-thiouridylase